MARQARSEATRQKILDAAIALFSEVGFSATGLGDIIERAELTKGALYYHFDSKDSVADAIIHEAADIVLVAARGINDSASPALEKLIHASFIVGGIVTDDKTVRAGVQLARVLGDFNRSVFTWYSSMQQTMAVLAREAIEEGDLREDLDPDWVGELLLANYLGAELLSIGPGAADDLVGRLTRM